MYFPRFDPHGRDKGFGLKPQTIGSEDSSHIISHFPTGGNERFLPLR